MATSHFLRLGTIASNGKLGAALRHNKREIQRELGASGHIDPARLALNYSLTVAQTSGEVLAKAKALREAAGVKRLRKNAVQAIEILFSLPANTTIDLRSYFADCYAWTANQFGADLVLSADVHLDEAAPHCHVLVLPLKDGRMVGSELMGNRQTLQARQADFYRNVGQRHGLAAPRKARQSAAERQAIAGRVLTHLRNTNDAALKSAGWALIRDHIGADPFAWATGLGLEVAQPKPPKKLRTVAQIFTSKGKGGRLPEPVERRATEHYGEYSNAL